MAEDPGSGPGQDLIDLVAPGGVDEANHGMTRYRVDNDGHIRVPREAAQWLIRAGFKVAPAIEPETQSETTAPDDEGGADDTASPRRVPKGST